MLLQSCDFIGELIENDAEYISKSQLYIGDLTLFLPKNKMIQYLGRPDSITGNWYHYDRLEILVEKASGIWDIICSNPKYLTPDGIKVGDSKEKVINTYGRTISFKKDKMETMIYEHFSIIVETVPLYLKFEIEDNIVAKIRLWFHYE